MKLHKVTIIPLQADGYSYVMLFYSNQNYLNNWEHWFDIKHKEVKLKARI